MYQKAKIQIYVNKLRKAYFFYIKFLLQGTNIRKYFYYLSENKPVNENNKGNKTYFILIFI